LKPRSAYRKDSSSASQDDWSFIIRAHALVEAALAQLLGYKLGHPEDLLKTVSRLPIGGAAGKLAFVKSLNAPEPSTIEFIEQLGVIRNDIVHKISDIDLRLSAYMKGLDEPGLRRAHKGPDRIFDENELIELPEGIEVRAQEGFAIFPTTVISASLRLVLYELHEHLQISKNELDDRRRYAKQLREALIQRLTEQIAPPPEAPKPEPDAQLALAQVHATTISKSRQTF
jgi:hypothetical protein